MQNESIFLLSEYLIVNVALHFWVQLISCLQHYFVAELVIGNKIHDILLSDLLFIISFFEVQRGNEWIVHLIELLRVYLLLSHQVFVECTSEIGPDSLHL
jgi:hypothetical protein